MSAENPGRLRRAAHFIRTEPGLLRNVIAVTVVVALGLGIGGTVLGNQRFTPPWQGETQVWATFAEAARMARRRRRQSAPPSQRIDSISIRRSKKDRGGNRTRVTGFAGPCLNHSATWSISVGC